MTKLYRVTPKNNKWIVQKVSDRGTVKQFIKKTDAENFMFGLMVSEQKNNTGLQRSREHAALLKRLDAVEKGSLGRHERLNKFFFGPM